VGILRAHEAVGTRSLAYLRGLQDRSSYSATSLTKPVRSRSHAGSAQAVHLVHVAAGDARRLVMCADRLLVRAFQEAVDLAVGVVVTLDLPHAELVGSAGPCPGGYLVDGLGGELRVIAEIDEPGRGIPPRSCVNCPAVPWWRAHVHGVRGGIGLAGPGGAQRRTAVNRRRHFPGSAHVAGGTSWPRSCPGKSSGLLVVMLTGWRACGPWV
jgi:hypothetical protein